MDAIRTLRLKGASERSSGELSQRWSSLDSSSSARCNHDHVNLAARRRGRTRSVDESNLPWDPPLKRALAARAHHKVWRTLSYNTGVNRLRCKWMTCHLCEAASNDKNGKRSRTTSDSPRSLSHLLTIGQHGTQRLPAVPLQSWTAWYTAVARGSSTIRAARGQQPKWIQT